MKRIVIAGGGTGGHIFPSLSIIKKIRELSQEKVEIIYIGSGSKLEQPLYEISDRSYTIVVGKWRRYFSIQNIFMPFKTLWGWFQSLMFLVREMPDVVFSKGGYVSFPVAFAALVYRIPVVIHESDAIPGITNRMLGKLSKKIAVGFDHAREYFMETKIVVTGNITQPDITQGDPNRARDRFSLSESKPVILVLGGSQGSQEVNENITEILEEILPFAQVLHQTGESKLEETKKRVITREGVKPGRRGYHPVGFLSQEEMRDALSVANLVISRSGATSIAELAACRKVSLLIPLASSANDHQRMNAFLVAEKDGALVLEGGNLSRGILLGKVKRLLFEEDLRENMKKNIALFDHPDSAEKVASLIIDFSK